MSETSMIFDRFRSACDIGEGKESGVYVPRVGWCHVPRLNRSWS
jgi:hypothetical protein